MRILERSRSVKREDGTYNLYVSEKELNILIRILSEKKWRIYESCGRDMVAFPWAWATGMTKTARKGSQFCLYNYTRGIHLRRDLGIV